MPDASLGPPEGAAAAGRDADLSGGSGASPAAAGIDRSARKQRVLAAFRRWDADGNGTISDSELLGVLRGLGVPEGDAALIFARADLNKDGRVDYAEFTAWLYTSAPAAVQRLFVVDSMDMMEDLGNFTLSRHFSGEGFPEEVAPEEQAQQLLDQLDLTASLQKPLSRASTKGGEAEEEMHRVLERLDLTSTPRHSGPARQGAEPEVQEMLAELGLAATLRAPPRTRAELDDARAGLCERLRATPFLQHTDRLFMHGRGYDGPVRRPLVTWDCRLPLHDAHGGTPSPGWLTASEFQDELDVATAKIRQLADLLRLSEKTVVYTGAGISAAPSAQKGPASESARASAMPTFTHYALAFLGQEGLIQGWVQQNHDGLPQKAGFPQERINEIHGSWFDPSNPVVKCGGQCDACLEARLEDDAETADLVLALGTSLGGLPSDRLVARPAAGTLSPPPGPPAVGSRVEAALPGAGAALLGGEVVAEAAGALTMRFDGREEPVTLPSGHPVRLAPSGRLGAACINLQQTVQDGCMTLRLFNKSDDVLRLLIQELGFSSLKARAPTWPALSRALVPYDADGRRTSGASRDDCMWLDLSDGQEVRIRSGHNIQRACQPQLMHIGAKEAVSYRENTRQPAPGCGTVVRRDEEHASFVLEVEGARMNFGMWWLEAAIRGAVPSIPVVNRRPRFRVAAGMD